MCCALNRNCTQIATGSIQNVLFHYSEQFHWSEEFFKAAVASESRSLWWGSILHVCNSTKLPYRDHLFSGSSDNTIKMWNSQSLELLASFKGHDDPVCTLACSESFLFSGSLRSIKVQSIELHTRAFLSSCGRGAEGSSSQSVFADV